MPMNRTRVALWICAALLLAAGGIAVADRRLGRESPSPVPFAPRPADRHYVSPQQLAQAGAVDPDAGSLAALDQHGEHRTWNDLSAGRPVVLVFVKAGCPCSVEFEPYFHRLAAAYPSAVRMVTIINGDVPTARRFADENQTPYPVLADAERAIIKRFHAEHGATVVLLSPSGKIETRWPGCSQDMMRDLSERIARLGQIEMQSMDVAGLPGALTAGCTY